MGRKHSIIYTLLHSLAWDALALHRGKNRKVKICTGKGRLIWKVPYNGAKLTLCL